MPILIIKTLPNLPCRFKEIHKLPNLPSIQLQQCAPPWCITYTGFIRDTTVLSDENYEQTTSSHEHTRLMPHHPFINKFNNTSHSQACDANMFVKDKQH